MASASSEALTTFRAAAIEWAAGGRGHPLVNAAADALAAGLDSPSLRILAGAPRFSADEEATELAPLVFEELDLLVHARLTSEAIVDGARLKAADFLANGGSPKALADELWRSYVNAGYPGALADWSGLADWYDMVDRGVIAGSVADVDAAVVDAACALVERRSAPHVPLAELFAQPATAMPLWRRFVRRRQR